MLLKLLARYAKHVCSNTVARSRNVYTSSATLTIWHFTRSERFHGDWNVADNNKTHSGFHVKFPIFFERF